jgi:hypothetical protein
MLYNIDVVHDDGVMKIETAHDEEETKTIAHRYCIHPDVVVVYEVGYNLVKIRRLSLSGPAVKHDNRKVFACYQSMNPIKLRVDGTFKSSRPLFRCIIPIS